MAVILNPNQDDENQQQNQQQGSSAPIQVAGTTPYTQTAAKQQGASPKFQTLKKFVDANKSADYNQRVTGALQKQAQNIEGVAQQAKVQSAPELQRLQQGTQLYQTLGQNLGGATQEQINAFRQLKRGQYRTDYSIKDMPKLQNQVASFQKLAGGVGSESGRIGLLKQAFAGQPGYTSGFASIDQLLLQRDPTKLQQLQSDVKGIGATAEQSVKNVQQEQEKIRQNIDVLGKQRMTESDQFIQDQEKLLYDPLEKKAGEIRTQYSARQADIKEKLRKGYDLTEDDYNVLGFTDPNAELKQEFTGLYNLSRAQQMAKIAQDIKEREITDASTYDFKKANLGDLATDITPFLALNPLDKINAESYATEEDVAKSRTIADLAEKNARFTKSGKQMTLEEAIKFDQNQAISKMKADLADKYIKQIVDEGATSGNVAAQKVKQNSDWFNLMKDATNALGAEAGGGAISGTGISEKYTDGQVSEQEMVTNPQYFAAVAGLNAMGVKLNPTQLKVLKYMTSPYTEAGLQMVDYGYKGLQYVMNNTGLNKLFGGGQGVSYADAAKTASKIAEKTKTDKAIAAARRSYGGGGGGGVIGAVKSFFCFAPNTPVLMNNYSSKPISEIKIGDKVFGGEVHAITKASPNPDDIYNYAGVTVTGSHPVYENGKWVKVKESKLAKKSDKKLDEVYTISTTNHRVMAGGILFSDFDEVDGDNKKKEKYDNDTIKELNKDKIKDNARLKALNELYNR